MMSNSWQTKKIGDFLTLEYGKPLDKSLRKKDGKYPAYGANGVKAWSDEFYYDKKTIIIGRKGSAGEITLTDEKFWPLDVTYFIKFDERKYDLYFLYYMLSCLNLTSLATGVKPGINRNHVYQIEVNVPNIQEQKRIVSMLDQAFADIEKICANAEKNLKNARELFESYLQQVFSSQYTECVMCKLGKIAENLDNKRVPITKKDRIPGKYPYYGASGIVDYVEQYIFDDSLLLISEDGANLLARTYPIAFSASGKFWVNNHAHVLKFKEPSQQKLVEYYLNSISLESYISGMAQPKLNQQALNNIPVPCLSDSHAAEIVNKLDSLSDEIILLKNRYSAKLLELDSLKKSLLHQAFTGQLTKKEVLA